MNSRTAKITPLLLVIVMTMSSVVYAPAMIASNKVSISQIEANRSPGITDWVRNSSSFALYNGRMFNAQYRSDLPYPNFMNSTEAIVSANLTNEYDGTYSNLSVDVFDFFTGEETMPVSASDIWYQLESSSGNVVNSTWNLPGINGHPCFFYLPNAVSLRIFDTVLISNPWYSESSLFRLDRTEVILGVKTIVLVNSTSLPGPDLTGATAVELWFSNDSSGLLMRVIGRSWSEYRYSDNGKEVIGRYSMDMSMEIGETNILDLTPPVVPEGRVPWMKAGKYIHYSLEGSGYIDPRLRNNTNGMTWQLFGDTMFRAEVSASITMKVVKGTTAFVEPWGGTRYIWVLHLMLNNTLLLLPDLRRAVAYLNQTFGAPLEMADELLFQLSSFNKTGLVKDTWFIVDNATGTMFMPGMPIGSLGMISPTAGDYLGPMLESGLGLQMLSHVSQSLLYEGWTVGIHNETHLPQAPGAYFDTYFGGIPARQRVDEFLDGIIRVVGTEYLSFPGGGGGHCWILESSLHSEAVMSLLLNRTMGPPEVMGPNDMMSLLMYNSTISVDGGGFIKIERTSGFPLALEQHLMLTINGRTVFSPFWDYSLFLQVFLSMRVIVPSTSFWFSNPPVNLIIGAGGNASTPAGHFGNFGFEVTTNGAGDVVITSSASQPPDTGAPPGGQLPFIYMDIRGVKLPGATEIILYVFYNRTRVQSLGIDEDNLRLYVWNTTTSSWVALQSTHLAVSSTYGVLFAVLPHLSYFAVFGPQSQGGGGATAGPFPIELVLGIGLAAIVLVMAVVYLRKRGTGKTSVALQAL